jgi:16S rRNA (adenine1518-N6/adenine1519-N6)-dimethyltransferase
MRRLGQHFLQNETILRKIASSLEISSSDTLIEIGPGHGELTKHLLAQNPKKLIVIEKDQRLAAKLKTAFPQANIEVIEADALKELASIVNSFGAENYKLCGNIPYYITGYLFRAVEGLSHKPTVSVFTIQKEVAERITANPPKMNLLSASIRFWAEPKVIAVVSKKDFSPAPQVDSAVISLQTKPGFEDYETNRDHYYAFIKRLFKQPRKTVLNNLSVSLLKKEEVKNRLESLGVDPLSRAQEIPFETILDLSRVFAD